MLYQRQNTNYSIENNKNKSIYSKIIKYTGIAALITISAFCLKECETISHMATGGEIIKYVQEQNKEEIAELKKRMAFYRVISQKDNKKQESLDTMIKKSSNSKVQNK